jgi:phosphate-selective porin
MSSRYTSTALFAAWLTASGCTLGVGSAGAPSGSGTKVAAPAPPAPDDDVQRRLRRLEQEIAGLKQGESEKGTAAPSGGAPAAQPGAAAQTGAAASPPQASAPPPADKPLLQWNVTPDITFKPGLRIQTRYSYNSATRNNTFTVERFRLKGAGELWKVVKYYAEMKIDNTGKPGASPTAAVENAWLDYTPLTDVSGRAGLYDVPFSRDALTSDSKLLFMDRSLIKDALTSFGLADNGIGAMVHGRPLGGRLEYAVGVFNNDKFDGLGTSSGTQASGWLMPAGRVAVDLLDPAPPGGYADYRGSYVGQGQRLTIGANAEWLGNAVDGPEAFDIYAWGSDLFFNTGPYTVQAEYDWFRQSGNVDISNYGWFVQGGYLLEPLNARLKEAAHWFPALEVAGRYQDLDAPSYNTDREHRESVGMNMYIHDHNLKIQTDYSWRQIEDTPDSQVFQIQLQVDF